MQDAHGKHYVWFHELVVSVRRHRLPDTILQNFNSLSVTGVLVVYVARMYPKWTAVLEMSTSPAVGVVTVPDHTRAQLL